MAIPASLQQFKSSGVYRLEFDKSQITNIPAETIRLVVGFSKKGPFNTPVFVPNTDFFREVFGEIDRALERKGSFFHRTCLTCLDRGPIIVLNLLDLDDAQDTTEFKPMSVSSSVSNKSTRTAPVSSYFNQDKFWFWDTEELLSSVATNHPSGEANILNFANIGRKPVSIITRKSINSGRTGLGFDVLAKEWYSNDPSGVPEFMNENDYISDYIIDVFIVEGDYSNYEALRIDPLFGDHFDSKGLKKEYTDSFGTKSDGINAFIKNDSVRVLGFYTGCLIPDFLDKNGENIFIEDIMNIDTYRTGVLCAIDKERFDDEYLSSSGIDLIGHTLESDKPSVIDFLSYYGVTQEQKDYADLGIHADEILFTPLGNTGATTNQGYLVANSTLQGATGYTAGFYNQIQILGPQHPEVIGGNSSTFFSTQQEFLDFADSLSTNSFIEVAGATGVTGTAYTANFVHFDSISTSTIGTTTDLITANISLSDEVTGGVDFETDGNFYYIGATATQVVGYKIIPEINFSGDEIGGTSIIGGYASELYSDHLNGILTDGDLDQSTGNSLKFERGSTHGFSDYYAGGTALISKELNFVQVLGFTDDTFTTGATITSIGGTVSFTTLIGDINEQFQITSQPERNKVVLDNGSTGQYGLNGLNGRIKVGDFLIQNFAGHTATHDKIDPITGKSRLTKILSVSENTDPLSIDYKKITVTTVDPIFVDPNLNSIERYKEIEEFVTNYRFHALKGYKLREAHMPNGTTTRMNKILDVMYNSNIKDALEDKENITFRYIVDTFNYGIEPSSKSRLSKIAKGQGSSLAILNFPSVKEFKDSTNPLFKFNSGSKFDPNYIASGGNLDLNPNSVYTLPGIADGANYSAFYGPNLLVRENGKTISVPPAGYVSNLFLDKYNLALPYSIVAGPRRGVVSGPGVVGVEYNYTRNQLDQIEPWGYNAILNKRGFGLVINANQTAQQTTKSALSQIHVRELLIYIQDGIEAILKNYRWEFNTVQNRLEIKTLADNFIGQILNDGGVYNFENVMDNSNNTSEVIDNNIGILDTYIEPVRGMGILVHRTTILKTGQIATGDFRIS